MTRQAAQLAPVVSRIDIAELVDLVESGAVRAVLPGMSANDRLRALRNAVWLRGAGGQIAIFMHQAMAGQNYRAVAFDVDADPVYVDAALQHMFDVVKADELTIDSPESTAADRVPGLRFGGAYAVRSFGNCFKLARADWLRNREAA